MSLQRWQVYADALKVPVSCRNTRVPLGHKAQLLEGDKAPAAVVSTNAKDPSLTTQAQSDVLLSNVAVVLSHCMQREASRLATCPEIRQLEHTGAGHTAAVVASQDWLVEMKPGAHVQRAKFPKLSTGAEAGMRLLTSVAHWLHCKEFGPKTWLDAHCCTEKELVWA